MRENNSVLRDVHPVRAQCAGAPHARFEECEREGDVPAGGVSRATGVQMCAADRTKWSTLVLGGV